MLRLTQLESIVDTALERLCPDNLQREKRYAIGKQDVGHINPVWQHKPQRDFPVCCPQLVSGQGLPAHLRTGQK